MHKRQSLDGLLRAPLKGTLRRDVISLIRTTVEGPMANYLSESHDITPQKKDGLLTALALGEYFFKVHKQPAPEDVSGKNADYVFFQKVNIVNTPGFNDALKPLKAVERAIADGKTPEADDLEATIKILTFSISRQRDLEISHGVEKVNSAILEEIIIARKVMRIFSLAAGFPSSSQQDNEHDETTSIPTTLAELRAHVLRPMPTYKAKNESMREELISYCPKWLPKKVLSSLIDEIDLQIEEELANKTLPDVALHRRLEFLEKLTARLRPLIKFTPSEYQDAAKTLGDTIEQHKRNRDVIQGGIAILNEINTLTYRSPPASR